MRAVGFVSSLALIVLYCQTPLAQNAAVSLKSGVLGAVTSAFADEPAKKPAIAPYSAVRKTTRVQKLANGVTITHETSSREARDSSGRTYRESQPETPQGAEVLPRRVTFYNVFDPVNRIAINWNSSSKEATVSHMPELGQARLSPPILPTSAPAPGTIAGAVFGTAGEASAPSRPPQLVREDLGLKTINGVEAKGIRTTQTFPAGAVGNDQPFTVTHETWTSRELRLAVLQIDDDPRTGSHTMELTDIDRGEPDPALFQPPEGYTVIDRYQAPQN